MKSLSNSPRCRLLGSFGVCVVLILLGGCNAVGTSSLASGRGVYNEVINRTEDEQILNMIVRLRYGQTFGMLAVANVAANVKTSANVGAEFGIGPSENYGGNLVPLSAGVAYEENPTISYVPLGGETFTRQMLSPLTLQQAVLISRVAPGDKALLGLMINRVNGLFNPILGHTKRATGFNRMMELFDELTNEIAIVHSTDGDQLQYFLQIYDYAGPQAELVSELLEVLGLTAYSAHGDDILVPIRAALARADGTYLNFEMKSVYDLIFAAGTSMQIPPEHLEQGIVAERPLSIPPESRIMQIRSSRRMPKNATVAVQIEGWWFYIDKTDHASKHGFLVLRTLIGMRLQDSPASHVAPILTIGVNN